MLNYNSISETRRIGSLLEAFLTWLGRMLANFVDRFLKREYIR